MHFQIVFWVKLVQVVYIFTFADQEERTQSIDKFRKGEKDVLVATDVASKGLDFPDIQHVINYDMPEDIENYGSLRFNFIVAKVKAETFFVL